MNKFKVYLGGIQWDFKTDDGDFTEKDAERERELREKLPEEFEFVVDAENAEEAVELAMNAATDETSWLIDDVIDLGVTQLQQTFVVEIERAVISRETVRVSALNFDEAIAKIYKDEDVEICKTDDEWVSDVRILSSDIEE
jgi:hypothetical protein